MSYTPRANMEDPQHPHLTSAEIKALEEVAEEEASEVPEVREEVVELEVPSPVVVQQIVRRRR